MVVSVSEPHRMAGEDCQESDLGAGTGGIGSQSGGWAEGDLGLGAIPSSCSEGLVEGMISHDVRRIPGND